MSMELFKLMTNTQIVHIPYKGSAPALTDLMGGHVMMIFDNTPNVLPHAKTGKMKAIAITSLKRSELAPEVPTVDESGVKGFEVNVWFGTVAHANTPRDIVNRLNAEINKALSKPDVKEQLFKQGVEATTRLHPALHLFDHLIAPGERERGALASKVLFVGRDTSVAVTHFYLDLSSLVSA